MIFFSPGTFIALKLLSLLKLAQSIKMRHRFIKRKVRGKKNKQVIKEMMFPNLKTCCNLESRYCFDSHLVCIRIMYLTGKDIQTSHKNKDKSYLVSLAKISDNKFLKAFRISNFWNFNF